MADAPTTQPPVFSYDELPGRFLAWCKKEPVQALLLAAIAGVLIYFFGFYKAFMNGTQSTAVWAKNAWNPENDLEHGFFILPIALFVLGYHAPDLAAARKKPQLSGLVFLFVGVALFVLAVRTLQERLALLAIPFLFYGIARYFWGKEVSRIVWFPCAFLLFAIPAGFLVQQTVGLQTLAAKTAAGLSNLIGIHVVADGATISALNGSFHFEVAGGCSGVRSLTAMTMLAALYVHFTQREKWKKILIMGSSLGFALIGNLVRLFSVVLFARFINPEIAGNQYHDYSGFVFFPIAVAAMVGFSNLLNRDWAGMARAALQPDAAPVPAAAAEKSERAATKPTTTTTDRPKAGESVPASYDY